MIERGDIRWFRFDRPDKRRPVLVLGRRSTISALSQIIVVPFSTTIRGLAGEMVLDEIDGLAVRSTIKVEWIRAVLRTPFRPRESSAAPDDSNPIRHEAHPRNPAYSRRIRSSDCWTRTSDPAVNRAADRDAN